MYQGFAAGLLTTLFADRHDDGGRKVNSGKRQKKQKSGHASHDLAVVLYSKKAIVTRSDALIGRPKVTVGRGHD